MSGRYLTELADWLRAAGLAVIEVDGWKSRARSSGGYADGRPWCVMWHHTASPPSTDGQNDVNYIISADTAPLANLYLDRSGTFWVCAAGATNTNGKGGPVTVSKGTVPLDQMNTYAVGVEIANDGVGERWPQVQVDAMFTGSNAISAALGNLPTDVCTHQAWAPTRKIDPARADRVDGPWRPRSVNGSGSWSVDDLRAECARRAGASPSPAPDPKPPKPPQPTPPPNEEDDDMLICVTDTNGTAWVGNGIERITINDSAVFDTYRVVHRDRFVNTSGKPITGWADVSQADDTILASIGQPR